MSETIFEGYDASEIMEMIMAQPILDIRDARMLLVATCLCQAGDIEEKQNESVLINDFFPYQRRPLSLSERIAMQPARVSFLWRHLRSGRSGRAKLTATQRRKRKARRRKAKMSRRQNRE